MAPPSAQKCAQTAACSRWGTGPNGREQIGHAVCKGKFRPWKDGQRMYGCSRHHAIRKRRIERAGVRAEWESFEQWERPPDPIANGDDANKLE